MKLYLVQHGETKPEVEDPQRGLTPKGEDEIKEVANIANHMDLSLSKIYHSGKLTLQRYLTKI